MDRIETAIIGAGPYGLSVAAHLSHAGSARVYGEPMRTWRTRMPPDMRLRSSWSNTSLSAPDGAGTLDAWVRSGDGERIEPVPLPEFLRYADWFRKTFVPELDTHDVATIELADGGVRVTTEAGEQVQAANAVLALGVTPFPRVPPVFAACGDPRIRIVLERADFGDLAGKRVAVIGAGNNGVESALLAHRANARVELLARSRVHWFTEHEPHTVRSPFAQRLYDLAYPVVGFGPPPINRLALHPDAFARIPQAARARLHARLLRPGAAPWLREHVEGIIPISENVEVEQVVSRPDELVLTLSDGTTREVDACIVACGFSFGREGLTVLAPELRERIAVQAGWPVIDRWFRSSVPQIHLVGFPAEGRFGPIARFVGGTAFAAERVADALATSTRVAWPLAA
jgi:cation diffusion facilitator CzcD-associated flavoprotein CzcO